MAHGVFRNLFILIAGRLAALMAAPSRPVLQEEPRTTAIVAMNGGRGRTRTCNPQLRSLMCSDFPRFPTVPHCS
jgi:hypothetical protein